MKHSKFYFIWLTVLLLLSGSTYSQQSKFKAIIVYNFTKYIEWPNITNNEFVITVLDNKELSKELKTIAEKKKIGVNKLIIKDITQAEEISNCQIVYIPNRRLKDLPKCLAKSQNQNVLIVTEFDNGCQKGAGINMLSDGGKLSFEIKKNNITSKGLTLSSYLVEMGKEIN